MTYDWKDLSKELHWPARADRLEDIEDRLDMAARLSRALWLALAGDISDDERDIDALRELASVVAEH